MAEFNEDQEQELLISASLQKDIKAKVEELQKVKKVKKVFPIAVEGDEDDEKDLYVAYFKEPTFADFSKFTAMGKSNETQALRQLGRDCLLDGDKELLDDDSLFLFGLMPQLSSIVRFRRSRIVNLSKAGK